MKQSKQVSIFLLLPGAGWPPVQGAITVFNPVPVYNRPDPRTPAPAADGGDELSPDPVGCLGHPQTGEGVLAELANTDDTPFVGRTFKACARGRITKRFLA